MMHLTLSFLRQEKRAFLQDRFFYIPQNVEEMSFDFFSFLPEKGKIAIEYCSGNGQWIVDRATKEPTTFWIAVERKWERAWKIWKKMTRRNLNNLLVVYGEAFSFSRHFLPDRKVEEIFVNFPDPWPKRRHGKHRLIQPQFVSEMSRILLPQGKATLVTDDLPYSEIICKEMLSSKVFLPLFDPPYFITEWPEYGSSFFETLWKSKGLEVRYMQFLRSDG
jgi:tRNA (guanine-N7-)-methyltransferase